MHLSQFVSEDVVESGESEYEHKIDGGGCAGGEDAGPGGA